MLNRIRPLHLGLGLLAFLFAWGVWWAATSSNDRNEDPLTPNIVSPGPAEHTTPLVDTGPRRHEVGDPRLGTPVEEPAEERVSLIVRVVDSKGAVIPTANVGITSPLGRTAFSMRRPDERHEFHDLSPGTWEVMTYAVSYVDQTRTLELDPAKSPIEVEVKLENALLLPVRFLTPSGDNAVEVLNSMEDSPLNGFDLYAVATNTVPDATLPPLAPGARPQYGAGLFHTIAGIVPGQSPIPHPGAGYAGVLELKQAPPLFVSSVLRETVLETLSIGASGARELTFTVNPEQLLEQLASVTLLVLDEETRGPIEDLHVTCDDANIEGSARDGGSVDSEGRITFSQRFPGWATVRAWSSGYEVFQKAVHLEPGETTDLGTIYLEKGITLTGRVENAAGEGVRSIFYSRDESWAEMTGPPEFGHTLGSSGRDGKLTLNGLGKRTYRVMVLSHGYSPQVVDIDLTLDEPEPLHVVLQPATKTILASRYDADLTHRVSIYDTSGTLFFSEYIPGKRTRETWLAPGEYSLVLHHGPREISRRTIEITEESAVHALTQ